MAFSRDDFYSRAASPSVATILDGLRNESLVLNQQYKLNSVRQNKIRAALATFYDGYRKLR